MVRSMEMKRGAAWAALVTTPLLVVAVSLYARGAGATETEEASRPALTQVEPNKVCMVNDQVFEQEQIPVEVEGKTYFGCCPMCKERLANDEGMRHALDPVSGEPVDKATAVIGMRSDRSVLYFASEENLRSYRAPGDRE